VHPQHNKEALEEWLPKRGINYEWWWQLGGWGRGDYDALIGPMREHGVDVPVYTGAKFPKQRIAAEEKIIRQEPMWTNTGLRDYSYYMTTDDFLTGMDVLIHRGKQEDVAVMCCECQWWRCHRSMIADYLAYRGVECVHIMPHMRQKNLVKYVAGPKTRSHSEVLSDRLERYEPYVTDAWSKWNAEVNGD
jgi:uncharacterized protein (DUF488 family)